MRNLRILVIDNSITFKETLVQELNRRLPPGSLVEHASQPVDAQGKLPLFKPTIIVLNFALASAIVNHEKFLPLLVKSAANTPIIAYGILDNSQTTAKRLGATIYLKKPSTGQPMNGFFDTLTSNILIIHTQKGAANTDIGAGAIVTKEIWKATKPAPPPTVEKQHAEQRTAAPKIEPFITSTANKNDINLIAIGASTGGTEAITTVLQGLRPPLPGIVIVQHIPPMFSKLFAERLNHESKFTVKEAVSGDVVMPNHIYIAPGGKHMTVKRMGSQYMLECKPGPPVHSVCPSVDVLFDSVAAEAGSRAMGVILTGMGRDGADGLLNMRQQGSHTLGQDAATATVYGMPKAAYEIGAVEKQLPLNSISLAILKLAQ